ncbi:unnamed protein product [Caenorhabditis nigoni]
MGGPTSLAELLAEVTKMTDMQLDENVMNSLKCQIRVNPLHRAMQSVLVDNKEKVPISPRPALRPVDKQNEKMLDNMLTAEGIVVPGCDPSHVADIKREPDFNRELNNVQNELNQEISAYHKKKAEFSENVSNVIRRQGEFRPISNKDIESMSNMVSHKLQKVIECAKQRSCENVTHLKRVYMDARRTRKNFSRHSTEILNAYFQAHITHPYPTEQDKEELARQCNISVGQVSNWFGNKRIRYKKMLAKEKSENGQRCAPQPMPCIPNPYMMQGYPMAPPFMFVPPNMPDYQQFVPKFEPPTTAGTSVSH